MFDIGWTELLVIGIVALIVIGPRELPKTLRTIGQMMTKVRRMASEFQGQFNDAIREAELDELRKEAEKLTNIKNPLGDLAGDLDPLTTIKNEIESAVEGTTAPAASTTPATESSEAKTETASADASTESAPGEGRSA